jgi:hypothetical protein
MELIQATTNEFDLNNLLEPGPEPEPEPEPELEPEPEVEVDSRPIWPGRPEIIYRDYLTQKAKFLDKNPAV